jgi:hypothetical protein
LFVFLYKEERIELMPAAQKQGKQMAAQKQGKQMMRPPTKKSIDFELYLLPLPLAYAASGILLHIAFSLRFV